MGAKLGKPDDNLMPSNSDGVSSGQLLLEVNYSCPGDCNHQSAGNTCANAHLKRTPFLFIPDRISVLPWRSWAL